ncbi:sensor histidine kinase [Leucobacter sp. W1153]|uniref:sensor histidine kinase n=1 Tax=Leucobacter sp. W1153 TaxID=3439064 RepID=UPI003F37E79C
MASPTLTPVYVVLRVGAHLLFFALTALVVIREILAPSPRSVGVIALSAIFLLTYALGAVFARPGGPRFGALGLWWIGALSLEWIVLLWISSEAAYLVFPLFFLYLHFFGRWWGPVAILVATASAICALGLHGGWSVGGVVGPLVGAGVALLIGVGTRELTREAVQRERLVRELLDTRSQLAVTEHEAGVLSERARLAREIHDTVAQGLSSIGMLLHAAERADPGRPGIEHLQLARETAAVNLTEARRFIRELTPPQLDNDGLGGALRRLADAQWAAQGLVVHVRVSDTVSLPMHVQTALLRIAQGAIANVIQHAHASTATISLAVDQNTLSFVVVDDGDGFDMREIAGGQPSSTDSFGLHATRERVQQLGGTLSVDSTPGQGTRLAVTLKNVEAP